MTMVRLFDNLPKRGAAASTRERKRRMKPVVWLTAAVSAVALSSAAARAAEPARPYAGALTPRGVPDLEGVWSNLTMSRFERPTQFGDRLVMTEPEVAEAEGKAADLAELGRKATDPKATVKDLPNDCGNGRD